MLIGSFEIVKGFIVNADGAGYRNVVVNLTYLGGENLGNTLLSMIGQIVHPNDFFLSPKRSMSATSPAINATWYWSVA